MIYRVFVFVLVSVDQCLAAWYDGHLLGAWPLEKDASELSGRVPPGLVEDAVTFLPGGNGVFTTAATFSQTTADSFIEITPPGSELSLSTKFTFTGWVKITASSAEGPIFSWYNNEHNRLGMNFRIIQTQFSVMLRSTTGSEPSWTSDSGFFVVDTWVHVAVTFEVGFSSNTMNIYKDGAFIAASTIGGSMTFLTPGPVKIGGWTENSVQHMILAQLQGLQLFDVTLEAADVTAIRDSINDASAWADASPPTTQTVTTESSIEALTTALTTPPTTQTVTTESSIEALTTEAAVLDYNCQLPVFTRSKLERAHFRSVSLDPETAVGLPALAVYAQHDWASCAQRCAADIRCLSFYSNDASSRCETFSSPCPYGLKESSDWIFYTHTV